MALLLRLQQECSQGLRASAPLTRPTLASPRLAPGSHTRNTMLHSRTTTNARGTMSGHGSTSSKCHVFRGSSWGSDTGKSFPVTLPHVYFVRICTLEGNSGAGERSQCPADDGWDSLPLWEGQTRTDGAQDTVGMSQQTDLYLTAAAGTAWGRKRGGQRSQPPKVHTAGKRRCFHSSGTAARS